MHHIEMHFFQSDFLSRLPKNNEWLVLHVDLCYTLTAVWGVTIAQRKMMLLLLVLLLHPFNGLFSRTTWVSRHQKGKPFRILLKQEMMDWQWHQLDHMQIICTSLQTDNHASTSSLSFYRLDALPAIQATASKHWRHSKHWSICESIYFIYWCHLLCIMNDVQLNN